MSTPPPLQVRVVQAITDVPESAWNALLGEDDAPFLEWQFLASLEESGSAVPEKGWHPNHFSLWRGSELVAAAPGYLKDDSHGEFVFDFSWASAAERVGERYYPKLILAVPFTPATGSRCLVRPGEDRLERQRDLWSAALEFGKSAGLSGVHVLFCTEAESRTLEELGFATRLGVQYHWRNADFASTEAFLARFNSKRRNQLKREMRAPIEQGVVIRTVKGAELANIAPKELFDLYASTVDKHVWGQRYLSPDFFARMLAKFSHRMELVEARENGKLIAGAFNLAGPRVLYGRYWGAFEEKPFLHFNVCLYHSIEDAIARKLVRFEPGAGGEHKLTRGFEPSLTYSAHWLFHPGLDRAVRQFLTHEQEAVRQGLPQWQAETGFK